VALIPSGAFSFFDQTSNASSRRQWLRGLFYFVKHLGETMQTNNFLQLSKPRQVLIRLCQRVNYGSILNVQVTHGEVCFDAPPDVSVDVRLDSDVPLRHELDLRDFALPAESCRLLAQIDSLKNGIIEKIVVHEGVPRRVVLRGPFPEVRI
jgi:hypothetical protein